LQYGQVLSSTREALHAGGVPQDAVFNAIPTIEALRRKGSVKDTGGEVIRINIINEKNNTGKNYSGHEAANLTPQDPYTIAYESWKQKSWSNTISGIDKSKNSGSQKIFDLMKQNEEVLYMSATEDVNADIWEIAGLVLATGVTADGGKAINSIPKLIKIAPDTANIVHGISGGTVANSAEPFWRNKATSLSGITTSKQYLDKLRTLVNNCNRTRGMGTSDLMVFDQVSYELLESALDTKVQYMDTNSASVGFKSINWKGVECIWDSYVPCANGKANGSPDGPALDSGTVYVLNSKAMAFHVLDGHDFKPTPFVPGTAQGQDNLISLTLLYAQLVATSRRNLGVGYAIPTSLT
jgi:hypothetical protein